MKFLACLTLILFGWNSAVAQLRNNYYFSENSRAVIDTFNRVAIIPGWVQLDPKGYSGTPEKLNAAEEEASIFYQNLLYSSLLLTNSSRLSDIYQINSTLIELSPNIVHFGLELSPQELCKVLNVEAVLLLFASYDKSFILNNDQLVKLFEQVKWNKPVKRKNVVIGLFDKSGKPLWAASFDTGGIKTTVREENQIFPITLYGYFGKM